MAFLGRFCLGEVDKINIFGGFGILAMSCRTIYFDAVYSSLLLSYNIILSSQHISIK